MPQLEQIQTRTGTGAINTVGAHTIGEHLAAHKTPGGQFWTVTHKAGGFGVTAGHRFDSLAQARRFAVELQRRLDFGKLNADSDLAWDAVAVFGNDNVRAAMNAALHEAYEA